MAKVNKKVRKDFDVRFGKDVSDYVALRQADISVYNQTIDRVLSSAKNWQMKDPQLVDTLGNLVTGILTTYELNADSVPVHNPPQQDGYHNLLENIIGSAEVLPAREKVGYFTEISATLGADRAFTLSGPSLQLLPYFATVVLLEAGKDIAKIRDAFKMLNEKRVHIGTQPAEQLLKMEKPTKGIHLTSEILDSYVTGALNGSGTKRVTGEDRRTIANGLINAYGIEELHFREGQRSFAYLAGNNGLKERIVVDYSAMKGGIPVTHADVLYEVASQLRQIQ